MVAFVPDEVIGQLGAAGDEAGRAGASERDLASAERYAWRAQAETIGTGIRSCGLRGCGDGEVGQTDIVHDVWRQHARDRDQTLIRLDGFQCPGRRQAEGGAWVGETLIAIVGKSGKGAMTLA